ncbi:flagellar motor stator protein MotA [Allochromatium vinosum]|uniref:MotA/TolQ/ExbB proton channel n=1 Tax=Allochromatium vinosum (strain ATCC 17899 / DSM 180 / NBRC 103801 / NCIMB 10441 / D) TaxID=572477 RepID=D3RRD7_ALLVD|nr:flagellar motor stator protein MotA [Allochromatium vinosum]ADC63849.1 MotA/TolQ/ExbB proton channel [Allochromatium vinosum DSM 180]
MNFILGSLIVIASVLGGFAAGGGHIIALWQPFELVIILGAAGGGFVIANPMSVVVQSLKSIPALFTGAKYKKAHYMEALGFLYELFNKARKEGLMGIEPDIEEPESSALFQKYPLILKDHHATEFISDYMRLVVSGNMNPFELENLMDVEIETHHHATAATSHAVQQVADGLPAFGIVAAVLGIVHTMAALGGPMSEIGGLVAAALVGTFSGILISYGFVGPIASYLGRLADEETRYLSCIKACILANVQGYSPQVAVEFGRKTMPPELRPNFQEFEQHLRGTK